MGTSAAAKYQVRWRPLGTEQWSRARDFAPRAEIDVPGLSRNTEYEFQVRSVAACGASSVWVSQGYTVPDPPALPPPGVPTTKPGPDGIDLDWGDGEDGVRGDLTYEIQRAKILAVYASAAALVAAHPTGTAGDAYFVGAAVYGWDGGGWADVDEIDNPAWATVAKTKSTTWTDVVLDTDQYTYRIRAIDYNGNVSGWVVIGQSESATISTIEFATEVNDAIAQEVANRLATDAALAQEVIDRTTADAAAAVELAVVRAQVGDILEADTWVNTKAYPKGDLVQSGGKLYRALQAVPAGTPLTNTAYWEVLGNYASLGEAVGATAAQVVVNTATIEQQGDDITAVSQTVAQHAARMPTGTGALATEARVTDVESASVSRDSALGLRASTIEARMPTGTDLLANEARVVTAETAAANAIGAVATALDVVETRMPSGTDGLATAASVTAANQARVDGDTANAMAITQVKAGLTGSGNLLVNAAFSADLSGWANTANNTGNPFSITRSDGHVAGDTDVYVPPGAWACLITNNVTNAAAGLVCDVGVASGIPVVGGKTYIASSFINAFRCNAQIFMLFFNTSGVQVGSSASDYQAAPELIGPTLAQCPRPFAIGVAPADAVTAIMYARLITIGSIPHGPYLWFFRPQFEEVSSQQTAPSPWSAGGSDLATVTQTMRADVDSVTGKVNAAYTVTLDVNGNISGFRSENDGTTSTFTIAAEKFVLASPGGGERTEFSGGNWRVYDSAGVMRVRMGVW